MPRPRSLTHTAIATAALAVIDRDGPTGLTMRAVAAELGMGTMSVYRYVEDRDQLEGLVVDLVLSDVDTRPPGGVPWPDKVAALTDRARTAVAAHPAVIPLLLIRRHASAASARWAEAVLAALTEGGFTGEDRVIAFRTLLAYLIGALQTERFGPLSGPGTAALAALPHTEFPFLSETARTAGSVPVDDEFRRGLAVVLRGLA